MLVEQKKTVGLNQGAIPGKTGSKGEPGSTRSLCPPMGRPRQTQGPGKAGSRSKSAPA
jgi:hypothetical protein